MTDVRTLQMSTTWDTGHPLEPRNVSALVDASEQMVTKRIPVPMSTMSTLSSSMGSTSTESGGIVSDAEWVFSWRNVAPEWTSAKQQFTWTWMLHTYGFACVFFMLAFYAFFSILNLRSQLSTRPFMTSINVFLCLLGVSRAASFLIDPYDSKGIMPETIGSILHDLAFPCLVSAFSLIQLAFLQLTQVKLGPSKLRSKSCLSLVVTTHFCLTIAINIVVTFQSDFKIIQHVTDTVFVCWGAFICIAFLYGGWHMISILRNAPAAMFHRSETANTDFGSKGALTFGMSKCNNLVAVTTAAAAAVTPTFLTPKIRITDENDQTYSYVSDNSHVSGHTPVDTERSMESNSNRVYVVSEDMASPHKHVEGDMEKMRMLDDHDDGGGNDNCRAVAISGCARRCQKVQPRRRSADEWSPKTSRGFSKGRCASRVHSPEGASSPISANGAGRDMSAGKRSHIETVEMNPLINSNGPSKRPLKTISRKESSTSLHHPELNLDLANNSSSVDCKQDLTLLTILNHIAYVNQAAACECKFDSRKVKPTRKSQIEKVLQATYASAILGLMLCVLESYRIYGPYGISAQTQHPPAWPWFIFQTVARLVEFFMGCFMANITKQPVNRHHYPQSYYAKQRPGLYF